MGELMIIIAVLYIHVDPHYICFIFGLFDIVFHTLFIFNSLYYLHHVHTTSLLKMLFIRLHKINKMFLKHRPLPPAAPAPLMLLAGTEEKNTAAPHLLF